MKPLILLLVVLVMSAPLSFTQALLIESAGSKDATADSGLSRVSMQDSADITLRGEYLKAFQTAYAGFLRLSEIPNSRKQLENYDVLFSEEGNNWIVIFSPRRQPGERKLPGGGTSLGHFMRAVVSKSDYRLIDLKGKR